MSCQSRSFRSLLLILALFLVAACGGPEPRTDPASPPIEMLVTAAWLSEHLDDPDLVVLDCTVRIERDPDGGFKPLSGRPAYEQGHIPGAGFADLLVDLSDPGSDLKYAVPNPERFCAAMGELGVGDDTRVVLYDGFGSVWAARVWWMLRWAGFERAALLDGGLGAWTAEGRPLSTEPVARPPRRLTPRPRPALIADQAEVRAAIDDDSVVIVDALPEAHYRGQMVLYERPGHIPTAVNVSAMALLDETGRYRSDDELAALCSGDRGARHIIYCGGGIAAASNAFVLVRLGFEDVAVYTASLQEWNADADNPLVVPEPGPE